MPLPARWIAALILAGPGLPGVASACSYAIPIEAFEPDVARANRGVDLFHVPGPPALKVEIGAIRRASSSVACDYAAEIDLLLDWSAPTSLPVEDVGLYWNEVGGKAIVDTFGGSPYKAKRNNGRMVLTLRVNDSPAGGELDFDVDVRAVDSGLRLGPPTRVHVHSNARPAERFESHLRWMDAFIAGYLPKAIPPADLAKRLEGFMEREQLERVRTGSLVLAPCGPYRPYACGATQTMVLRTGERPVDYPEGATEPTACIGVRQAPDRVAVVAFAGKGMITRIVDAAMVLGPDAATWPSAAAHCPG